MLTEGGGGVDAPPSTVAELQVKMLPITVKVPNVGDSHRHRTVDSVPSRTAIAKNEIGTAAGCRIAIKLLPSPSPWPLIGDATVEDTATALVDDVAGEDAADHRQRTDAIDTATGRR